MCPTFPFFLALCRRWQRGGKSPLPPSSRLQTSLPFDCLIRVSHWSPFFNIDSRQWKKEREEVSFANVEAKCRESISSIFTADEKWQELSNEKILPSGFVLLQFLLIDSPRVQTRTPLVRTCQESRCAQSCHNFDSFSIYYVIMKKQFWPKSRQSRSQEQKRIAAKIIYFFAEKKKIEWKFRKEKESFFSTGSKKFEPEGWSARMKRFRPDLAADDRVRFNHDTHVTQLWRCCDAFQNSTATRDTRLTTQGGERRSRKERTFPGKQKYFFLCPESGLALSFATCCCLHMSAAVGTSSNHAPALPQPTSTSTTAPATVVVSPSNGGNPLHDGLVGDDDDRNDRNGSGGRTSTSSAPGWTRCWQIVVEIWAPTRDLGGY